MILQILLLPHFLALYSLFLHSMKNPTEIVVEKFHQNTHMMLKKRSTDFSPKKTYSCVVQWKDYFYLTPDQKRWCWSYLTDVRDIYHTSDVSYRIIAIRYDKHPLFGPALDKNKPSTTRPDQWFFFGQKSVDLFFKHQIGKLGQKDD